MKLLNIIKCCLQHCQLASVGSSQPWTGNLRNALKLQFQILNHKKLIQMSLWVVNRNCQQSINKLSCKQDTKQLAILELHVFAAYHRHTYIAVSKKLMNANIHRQISCNNKNLQNENDFETIRKTQKIMQKKWRKICFGIMKKKIRIISKNKQRKISLAAPLVAWLHSTIYCWIHSWLRAEEIKALAANSARKNQQKLWMSLPTLKTVLVCRSNYVAILQPQQSQQQNSQV